MATATTTEERNHNLLEQSIQDAIQDLVKSCGIHESDGQEPSTSRSRSTELQRACEELREKLPFHSNEGRHLVIRELTKLHGNYVVKIVRRGLCSLSKVYSTDAKTFENEATELVKLCCLQYSMQTGSEGGHQVASPANVIQWTVELCDEIMRPPNDGFCNEDTSSISGPFLVKCLAELADVYKSIMYGRMNVLRGSGLDKKVMDPFKSLFDALKPRIKYKGFEELIEQTAAIVKTEEHLDFMNFSSTGVPKTAILLEHWISLLECPVVTNWFAFQAAKNDFLVHDSEYASSLPFNDLRIYLESLIVQVNEAFNSLISSNNQYQFSCDKTKLQLFFDNSEVLLRHTLPCLHLMQSEIDTSLLKEIFFLLQIELHRDLLPGITDSDRKQCQPVLDAFQKMIRSPDQLHLHLQGMMEVANATQVLEMKNLNHICTSRPHQTASFDAITRALLALPDKQQVLKILQIWKKNFPDDKSYVILSELFALVEALIQTRKENASSDLESFIAFLLQLTPDIFLSFRIWRPLIQHLLVLPSSYSCYVPEVVNLIRMFVDLHVRNAESSSLQNDGAFVQTFCTKIQIFLREQPMKQDPKFAEVKIKSMRLGLELFEEVQDPKEYAFVLNVIHSVAADIQTSGIKTFTMSLLKTARKHLPMIKYPEIWQVISLIDQSRGICGKCEVYNSYLEVLQEVRGDDVVSTVQICTHFLMSSDSINTDNTKAFFALAAKGRTDTCQFVLECLFFNRAIICGDRVNKYIAFLLTIVENTLSSDRKSCQLFFKTIHDYLQRQLLAYHLDTFEMIIASIAGSIDVGSFDRNLNEVVLKELICVVESRKLTNQPEAILNIYVYLSQTLGQVSAEKGKRFMELFGEGVRLIMRLPLNLQQIKWIIKEVISILDEEKITDEESVRSIMMHLFKMGNGSCTAIDHSNLESHFKKVLKPSIIRNTAQIFLLFRQKEKILSGEDIEIPLDSVFSLSDLLVERMPNTFAKKTSADLFKFIVKRVEKNQAISFFILPVAEAIVKVNASEYKLKTEIKEIEETFKHVQPQLVPIISECLRQYYLLEVNENKSIKDFILQILECFRNCKLNLEDTHNMMESILNIPKQLVLVYQRASNDPGVVKDMVRVLDVASKVDRVIFNGQFLLQFTNETVKEKERLGEMIQHDFFMAVTKSRSLTVSDACTVLEFYKHLKPKDFHAQSVLTLSENFDAKKGISNAVWLTEYSRHSILTPGNLVYLVLVQLTRIGIPKSDAKEKTLAICSKLLINFSLNRQVPCHCLLGTTFAEYIETFFLVLNQVSRFAEVEHWLTFLPHHAVQTRDVFVAACSWKASSESRTEVGRMMDGVSKALLMLLAAHSSGHGMLTPQCYAAFAREIQVMALVLSKAGDEEIANKLLNLILTSRNLTEACLGIVHTWNKKESLAFIEQMEQLYKERNKDLTKDQVDIEMATPLQLLPFAAKAFSNSTVKVVEIFTTTTEMVSGPDDPLSLERLPVWFKLMTDSGYSPQVIESWCTSLILSKNLCSSDVDAITNINPEMIKVLNSDSNEVGRCLFSKEAPKTWKSEGETDDEHRTNMDSFKRCLLFAKLLNELASITACLKENVKAVRMVRESTTALCAGFSDTKRSLSNLYKIRDTVLKGLFVLLFGEDTEEEQPKLQTAIMTYKPLSKSLIILFRRLARSFTSRPTLLGIITGIVRTIPLNNFGEVEGVIQEAVLSLEPNQDAMQILQASGYNQCTSPREDLWHSSSIEMPAYVGLVALDESFQLERSLRQLGTEWRDILSENKISEISLGDEKLKTTELFKPSDLETIESHLQAVKQATKSLPRDNWSSYRRRQLIRNEKRLRNNNEEQKKQVKEMSGSKLTKMVIVWQNQLLESVKTCSEKIPGCYAQNGFHSEKPVICGIAVDNRILTLYKEDKGGTRTELENVEVKLYPAGMVVFGAYRSIHPYDTEQLWAAFYKMLLDKHLVPKIFITNVSPAFDWIKKFVTPEPTPPQHVTFQSCCELVPSSEDSFDYDPEINFHLRSSVLESSPREELIILTADKIHPWQFTELKPPNRNQMISEKIEDVVLHLQARLQEMHPKSHDKILARMKFAIRQEVEAAVDGREPTQESISSNIDMTRLLYQCQDAHQYSKDEYCDVILDAVKTVTGDLRDSRRSYDGCQHVLFTAIPTIPNSD